MRILRAAPALLALSIGLNLPTMTAPSTAMLDSDPTMRVDETGQAFAVEPTAPAPATVTAGPAAVATTATAEALRLHSSPGSKRTIFLDFDGEVVSGSAWNTAYHGGTPFTAAPYDSDGHPSTFSTIELGVIKSVWQRVSEDYAPFDVDVTTEAPPQDRIDRAGPTDDRYGTRALITNTTIAYRSCHCGGISYIGTFDSPVAHDRYQPNLVFQQGLGSTAKVIAEAASHEVGHSLGLHHDGTATIGYFVGQGAWAPIMGVGYYRPVSQWSRGEYAGANNKEDDLAVMAAHGIALRADDYGSSITSANALTGPSPRRSGRIERSTDVDAFTFSTGGGVTTIAAAPAATGADLDIRLRLLTSAGKLLALTDPVVSMLSPDAGNGLAASVRLTLPAGRYLVVVEGVGAGSPGSSGYSDYASLGTYTLSATVPRPR